MFVCVCVCVRVRVRARGAQAREDLWRILELDPADSDATKALARLQALESKARGVGRGGGRGVCTHSHAKARP